jgi:hypothetical protein
MALDVSERMKSLCATSGDYSVMINKAPTRQGG